MRKFIGWVQIIISSIVLFILIILIIYNLYSINDPELITNKYPKAGDNVSLFVGYLVLCITLIVILRKGIKRVKEKETDEDIHPMGTSGSFHAEDKSTSSSEIFRLNEDGLKQLRTALFKKIVPIYGAILLAGLSYSTYQSIQENADIFVIILPLILITVFLVIGARRSVNQQVAILKTYRLTLHTNYISREQSNLPIMEIANDEIESITKNSDNCIIIRGTKPQETIYIPAQLENIDKLEQRLSKIKEITDDNGSFLKKKAGIIAIITVLALFATVILATNKIIVCIAGVILLILMGYSLYKIQTNKSIDKKTKDASWFILIVAASIAYAIYSKVTMMP
jgi:uncharacterized membrane protein/NADH:ubiquinone oxidoreductase subunit 6 (subunit J)